MSMFEKFIPVCCVCGDMILREEKLWCEHGLCYECLTQLNQFLCPVCREPLNGFLVFENVKETIVQREKQLANLLMERDETIATYIQKYPRVNMEDLYTVVMRMSRPKEVLKCKPDKLMSLLNWSFCSKTLL